MLKSNSDSSARSGRELALTGLAVAQVICIVFFLVDVSADLLGWDDFLDIVGHNLMEMAAVAVLAVATALTVLDIRRLRRHQHRIEEQLRIASGAFLELLEEHFDGWGLTPSERDVALLTVKGLPIAEIAAMRSTKEGTVKAQCNAIYSKAGVSGRHQLLSLFIEELMAEGLVPARTAA